MSVSRVNFMRPLTNVIFFKFVHTFSLIGMCMRVLTDIDPKRVVYQYTTRSTIRSTVLAHGLCASFARASRVQRFFGNCGSAGARAFRLSTHHKTSSPDRVDWRWIFFLD